MKKTIAGAFLIIVALFLPQVSAAGVYICLDPDTGKKTFTDRACPSAGQGKKVRVEPTNFGQGTAKRKVHGTWTADKDRSISGRANLPDRPRIAANINGKGMLSTGS